MNITAILRELRQEKEIRQEDLAVAMGVSVQAVSKWETGISYPDIMLLPDIARYFNVTVDYLLTGEGRKEVPAEPEKVPACIPAEGLQVVVAYYRDGQLLHQEMPEQPIELGNIGWYMERESAEGWGKEPEVHVSIYGDAEVAGKINGNVETVQNLSCEKVNGNVQMAQMVETGKVNGNVTADTVHCENGKINGNVRANVVHGPFKAAGDVYRNEEEQE